jgi:hypothetical protein
MEIFGFSPDDVDRGEMVADIQRQIRWIGTTPVFAPPKGGKTRLVRSAPESWKKSTRTWPPSSLSQSPCLGSSPEGVRLPHGCSFAGPKVFSASALVLPAG